MYVGMRWIKKPATASRNGIPSPNVSRENMLIKIAKSIPSILDSQQRKFLFVFLLNNSHTSNYINNNINYQRYNLFL